MPGLRLGRTADGAARLTGADGNVSVIAPANVDAPVVDEAGGAKNGVVDGDGAATFSAGGTAQALSSSTSAANGVAANNVPRSLGVIDLRDPPEELRANIELLACAALLSGNSLLGDKRGASKLTFEAWRRALPLLASFPPEVRRSIVGLAPFFAKEPNPVERHVDIAALPTWLLAQPSVMAAIAYLQRDPNDASPHVVTDAKLQAAEAERARLPPAMQEGIAYLRGAFLDPPASDELQCKTEISATGARVFSYPGSEKAVSLLEGALKMLAQSPRFAEAFQKINIVLAPPGQPLSYVTGAKGEGANGMALMEGLDGLDDEGEPRRPTLAVDVESVMRSNIVVAHELIHLVELMDPALMKDTDAVFARFITHKDGRHPYANPREMLAYLGEWYVAGQGAMLAHEAPEVFALCLRALGRARVPTRGVDMNMAEASIHHLVGWLQTGRGTP